MTTLEAGHVARAFIAVVSDSQWMREEEDFGGFEFARLIDTARSINIPFPIALAASIGRGAALGLAQLHERENPVIHGAIRPGHIVSTTNGEGIIVDLSSAVCDGELSRANHFLKADELSHPYAAPEVVDNPLKKSAAADVYQLAACLGDALSASPIPCGKDATQQLEVGSELTSVLDQALQAEIGQRLSARELADALSQFCPDQGEVVKQLHSLLQTDDLSSHEAGWRPDSEAAQAQSDIINRLDAVIDELKE